jgi:arylsulfatase A
MNKPNIILINCDDLGYGDLGCYGSRVNATPYLDRMAAEGMLFTDYHVMSPVCSASRAAMLTGCYPQRVGIKGVLFPGDPIGLHPDEITIADILKGQGYKTKIVGKWHCGDQEPFLPTKHGFDSYYGLPYSNDMGIQGKEENRPKRVPLPLMRNDDVIQQQPDQRGLTERYTEECVRFIRDNAPTHAAQAAPFFLYLAHMYVHVPLFVPDRFMRQTRNGGYGGAVECIDWVAGVLFDELRRQGLDENTMVIFTSDNGSRASGEGGSNDPLRGTKATTWEGGQRVPCIVRWPGQVPAGRVCDEPITSMDFLPTLARIAGGTEPQDRKIDGKDISPLLSGREGVRSPHDVFYYYMLNRLHAVRKGKWKLHFATGKMFVRQPDAVQELYDLENDVGETQNVYDAHPEVVAELQAVANAARVDLGDALTGVEGQGGRPVGHVENPVPLAVYNANHPYIVAAYDKPDTAVMGG